ncbi:MAG TPA: tyrosine-type recombinase/integrase [Candidatus Binataceae bacterium]|jgi:integrase|nr:tyrosine-type recombinase/integrase [Candidatus Binataceae bacterium]
MAWLETDRHGRLRIGFKYYDGSKCREPLGVVANKQTLTEARRFCATIQLELKARTFDYARRFPDSDRLRQLGIKTPEQVQPMSVSELAESWLLSKQGEVKKSTHGYYKEVAGVFIQRDALGEKLVRDLRQEDIDRWRGRVDEKLTQTGGPLSTRRKNMAWDVLKQIIEFTRTRKLLGEDLLLGMKPFKDSGQASDEDLDFSEEPDDGEAMPYRAEEIEAIVAAAEGWERALVTFYFFTGIRRGEALALTWDKVYLDRDRALINRSLSDRYGVTTPKTKSSRRLIQFGPRVRAELLKQRERMQLRSKYVFPNESGGPLNVRWGTDVVWRRILDRAGLPHRPIGQCRHSFAVLALKQHKPLNWIQRQMGHRTLQMLLKHYWRWTPTEDLSTEEMASLENSGVLLTSNHAHPVPTRPDFGSETGV